MQTELKCLLEYRCDGVHAIEGPGTCTEVKFMYNDKPEWPPRFSNHRHIRMALHVGNYFCGVFQPFQIWVRQVDVDAELQAAHDEYRVRYERAEMGDDDKTTGTD